MIDLIGHSARVKHIEDDDADFFTPEDILIELKENNLALTQRMRRPQMSATSMAMCRDQPDRKPVLRGAERRTWFQFESTRRA